jgi:uncharacterized protein YbjT (DUF2867 family)
MKVIVIGASHGLGAATVRAALAAGHHVTAFARHPENLNLSHAKLRRVAGDVTDHESVSKAIRGQDAVVITLGLPTLRAMGLGRSQILSRGTRHVVEAMQTHGVPRLVLETAVGSGESRRNLSWLAYLALRVGLGYQFREKDRQEEAVRASGLDWTIIRPTALINGPATRHRQRFVTFRAGLFSYISRRDVADEMISLLAESETFRHAYVLSQPSRPVGDWYRWLKDYRE